MGAKVSKSKESKALSKLSRLTEPASSGSSSSTAPNPAPLREPAPQPQKMAALSAAEQQQQYEENMESQDVIAVAGALGLDISHEAEMLWIAEELYREPAPLGWKRGRDEKGQICYRNEISGENCSTHPLEHLFKEVSEYQRKAVRDGNFYNVEDEARAASEDEAKLAAEWNELFDSHGLAYWWHEERQETIDKDPALVAAQDMHIRFSLFGKMKRRPSLALLHAAPPLSTEQRTWRRGRSLASMDADVQSGKRKSGTGVADGPSGAVAASALGSAADAAQPEVEAASAPGSTADAVRTEVDAASALGSEADAAQPEAISTPSPSASVADEADLPAAVLDRNASASTTESAGNNNVAEACSCSSFQLLEDAFCGECGNKRLFYVEEADGDPKQLAQQTRYSMESCFDDGECDSEEGTSELGEAGLDNEELASTEQAHQEPTTLPSSEPGLAIIGQPASLLASQDADEELAANLDETALPDEEPADNDGDGELADPGQRGRSKTTKRLADPADEELDESRSNEEPATLPNSETGPEVIGQPANLLASQAADEEAAAREPAHEENAASDSGELEENRADEAEQQPQTDAELSEAAHESLRRNTHARLRTAQWSDESLLQDARASLRLSGRELEAEKATTEVAQADIHQRQDAALVLQSGWRGFGGRRISESLNEEVCWPLKAWFEYSTTAELTAQVEVKFLINTSFDAKRFDKSVYHQPSMHDDGTLGTETETSAMDISSPNALDVTQPLSQNHSKQNEAMQVDKKTRHGPSAGSKSSSAALRSAGSEGRASIGADSVVGGSSSAPGSRARPGGGSKDSGISSAIGSHPEDDAGSGVGLSAGGEHSHRSSSTTSGIAGGLQVVTANWDVPIDAVPQASTSDIAGGSSVVASSGAGSTGGDSGRASRAKLCSTASGAGRSKSKHSVSEKASADQDSVGHGPTSLPLLVTRSPVAAQSDGTFSGRSAEALPIVATSASLHASANPSSNVPPAEQRTPPGTDTEADIIEGIRRSLTHSSSAPALTLPRSQLEIERRVECAAVASMDARRVPSFPLSRGADFLNTIKDGSRHNKHCAPKARSKAAHFYEVLRDTNCRGKPPHSQTVAFGHGLVWHGFQGQDATSKASKFLDHVREADADMEAGDACMDAYEEPAKRVPRPMMPMKHTGFQRRPSPAPLRWRPASCGRLGSKEYAPAPGSFNALLNKKIDSALCRDEPNMAKPTSSSSTPTLRRPLSSTNLRPASRGSGKESGRRG